jgi:hypothetical protein
MSADSNDDYDELEADAPTGIARCASSFDDENPPYVVHGVAIGADDVTAGEAGLKFWPAEELRQAAETLVGVPLNKNHDDERVEAVVGEVVDAGYEDGVGVVFEAEVDDREIAEQIERGRLDVSIHALHRNGGTTEDSHTIAEDVHFLDLSVVPRGASQSNYVAPGSSPSEALASLSAEDVAGMIASPDTNDSPDAEDDDARDEASEQSSSADGSADSMTSTEDSESTDEAEEAEASADEPVDADVDEDVEEAELQDDGVVEAEASEESDADADEDVDVAELRDEIDELRAENEELRQEMESVRLEYAERLADESPFEAEELTAKFSFEELQSKFEEADDGLVDEPASDKPAPRTGSPDEDVSTSDTEADEAEIAELEAKIEQYGEMGWDSAKSEAEARLADLRE